ncbi:MAG: hypothetical protein WAV32_09940 [Halobacteriota archaeon]
MKSGKPYDVLGDGEVIKSSRLAMPRVLRIYKGIEMAACENPGVPPRSVEELLKVMKGNYGIENKPLQTFFLKKERLLRKIYSFDKPFLLRKGLRGRGAEPHSGS